MELICRKCNALQSIVDWIRDDPLLACGHICELDDEEIDRITQGQLDKALAEIMDQHQCSFSEALNLYVENELKDIGIQTVEPKVSSRKLTSDELKLIKPRWSYKTKLPLTFDLDKLLSDIAESGKDACK